MALRSVNVPKGLAQDLGVSGVDGGCQTVKPVVDVVTKMVRSTAARLEDVLHRGDNQLVVVRIVAEDRPRAHVRNMSNLLDRCCEASPGHDFHRGRPDPGAGELLLLLG